MADAEYTISGANKSIPRYSRLLAPDEIGVSFNLGN